MTARRGLWTTVLYALLLEAQPIVAQAISLECATSDTGYNVGSIATIRARLTGISGNFGRYAVFAEIQYIGTTAVTSVQMEPQAESKAGDVRYEVEWPISSDAPTGLYSVTVHAEDRSTHKVVSEQKLRGFAVYKKLVRITRVRLDKTFYIPGELIQCEVALQNLTDRDMKNLRIEFSNANYPWISTFSGEASLAGKQSQNPELAPKVLRDDLTVPARSEATIPMMPAGTAAFLQGAQMAVLGAGGPARHEKIPPPEVDQYTIAVWNADRTALYDMQFSPPAIVRTADRDLPKPYSHNFTHAYNFDIDFTKYREFYAPGQISPAILVNRARRTLYRPGDQVTVKALLANTGDEARNGVDLRTEITDLRGKPLQAKTLLERFDLAPGQARRVEADASTLPASLEPGAYLLKLSVVDSHGKRTAATKTEIAVNALPASLLVFCPHEDDEHAYAGLIRAAIEAKIPVRVVIFTGGDVGACERYYSKPCGPNEAREFGLVRMEESAEALEHIGLTRDKLRFLGLPDGGSGAIWSQHIKISNPFMSIYLACDHAPYENVLRPNLPYARDAVIDLIRQIILDFRPAMMATPHPDERHVDHRTANWFVIKACQELLRQKKIDPQTVILADQAYGARGFKPAPYHYEKVRVFLSGEAAALKQEMSWLYQSQDGNLAEGLRKTFAELPREEIHYRIVDWQEHEGWNE